LDPPLKRVRRPLARPPGQGRGDRGDPGGARPQTAPAHAAGGLLRASFASLCAAALGPQDYLAIAARFHTVFLEAVPVLTPDRRNEARRFVDLIDALYEADARLVMLAPPNRTICTQGRRSLRIRTHGLAPARDALGGVAGEDAGIGRGHVPRSRRLRLLTIEQRPLYPPAYWL